MTISMHYNKAEIPRLTQVAKVEVNWQREPKLGASSCSSAMRTDWADWEGEDGSTWWTMTGRMAFLGTL